MSHATSADVTTGCDVDIHTVVVNDEIGDSDDLDFYSVEHGGSPGRGLGR
jgi:hypothetical protein